MVYQSIPRKFESIQDFHEAGFFLESEITYDVQQTWIQVFQQSDFSVTEFAKQLQCSRTVVYYYLHNERVPDVCTALRIADVLRIPFQNCFQLVPKPEYGLCQSNAQLLYLNKKTLEVIVGPIPIDSSNDIHEYIGSEDAYLQWDSQKDHAPKYERIYYKKELL